MTESSKCHCCGVDWDDDWICRDCGQVVCEKCVMPYNQFTQIDYTLCGDCNATNVQEAIWDADREAQLEQKESDRKAEIARKRKETYNLPENVAKREASRIRKNEEDQARRVAAFKAVFEVFSDTLKRIK